MADKKVTGVGPQPPDDERGQKGIEIKSGNVSNVSSNSNINLNLNSDISYDDFFGDEKDNKIKLTPTPNPNPNPNIQPFNEAGFQHYFGKLTSDKTKLAKIKEIIINNGLNVPDKMAVFRKGCVVFSIGDKFIMFDPLLRFCTVLDFLSPEYKVVIISVSIKKRMNDIVEDIKNILKEK